MGGGEEKVREGQVREGEVRERQVKEGEVREGEVKEGEVREGEVREGLGLSACLKGCVQNKDEVPHSGKHLRGKTFANLAVLWLFAKVFSAKIGVLWRGTSEQSARVSPRNRILHQFAEVFSLEIFLLYM